MQIKCPETVDNQGFIFYLQSPPANKVRFFYFSKNKKGVQPGSTNKREAEKVLMQRLTAINENKYPVLQKRKKKKNQIRSFFRKIHHGLLKAQQKKL